MSDTAGGAVHSYAWVDGAVVPRDEARVSIDDFAVRYGAACFETMLARGGRVFRLAAHLDRLEDGLRGMGVEVPDRAILERAVDETLAANALTAPDVGASVRLTVTAGSGHVPALSAASGPSVIVTADPLPPPSVPPRLRVAGTRIDARRPLRGAKTSHFLPYLLARAQARAAGADDAVLLNHDGAIVEAATANLFVLRDGTLHTPALDDGPLPGVTRAALIEVARSLDVAVVERTLGLGDLAQADAILLTSSIAGIVCAASLMAVVPEAPSHLDWTARDPAPPVLARLIEAYESLVGDEHQP